MTTEEDIEGLFEIESQLKRLAREKHPWLDENNLFMFVFPIWLYKKYKER